MQVILNACMIVV